MSCVGNDVAQCAVASTSTLPLTNAGSHSTRYDAEVIIEACSFHDMLLMDIQCWQVQPSS